MEAFFRLFVGAGPNEGALATPDRRRIVLQVLLAAEIVVLVAACVLVVVRPSVGLHWDFANYYDAGRKVLYGQIGDLYNEFALIGGRQPQGRMAFASTPITAYLHAPMALLPPTYALAAFKFSGLAATAAALWLIWRRVRGPEEGRLVFAALFLGAVILFPPFWTIYPVGGQVTPWILLLLVAGWLAHEQGRFWRSAACFVAAVALKPFLAPGLVFLALLSGPRFLLASAILGAGAALTSVGLLGWPIHRVFLEHLADMANIQKPIRSHSGLASLMDAALIPFDQLKSGIPRPPLAAHVELAVRLIIAALFFAFAFTTRTWPAAPRRNLVFLLAMTLPVLVTPIAWGHYLSLLFPLLAWALAKRAQLPASACALLSLIFCACIEKNRTIVYALAERLGVDTKAGLVAMGALNSLALLLLLAFLLAYWRPLSATFRSVTPSA